MEKKLLFFLLYFLWLYNSTHSYLLTLLNFEKNSGAGFLLPLRKMADNETLLFGIEQVLFRNDFSHKFLLQVARNQIRCEFYRKSRGITRYGNFKSIHSTWNFQIFLPSGINRVRLAYCGRRS